MFNKIKLYFCPIHCDKVNIHEIFKPIYYTLTLFGLFPYSIRYNDKKKCFKIIKFSIYIRLTCAAAFIVIIYVSIFDVFQKLLAIKEDDSHRIISKSNYLIELVAYLLYCTVVYICNFLNRHRYVRILNTIAAAWTETGEDNRRELVRHIRFHINVLVMGAMAFIFIVNLVLVLRQYNSTWENIRLALIFQLPRFIQFASLAFHFTLVMIVATLLSDINMHLDKWTKRKTGYNEMFIELEARRSDLSLGRMELAYMRAFDIKSDISDAFEAPLLISTIQCFHAILISTYMAYHGIVGRSLIYPPFLCFVLIMAQVLKVFSLAYAGYKLKSQVLQIGQALHRIPTELHDTITYTKIQHFCTLMKCHRFELSVYGFFSLDMTLIYTMVASVTMYLLVLIQLEH